MNTHVMRRAAAATLVTAGLGTATVTGGGALASADPAPPTSTTMTCSSANPLFWAPSFTWNVQASSGESRPPGGELEPSILLSGGNELPVPPGGLIPSIGPNWYGTRVLVDWHNTTTGASGHSVSDAAAWQQAPGIPINRTWAGTGTVDVTVTVQTGAGWWFVNPQNAVCTGTLTVVPGR